jgi:hypothetical protein
VIEVDKCVARPQARPKFITSDQVAWPFQQHLENREWVPGEFDPNAISPQFTSVKVGFVRSELDPGRFAAGSLVGFMHRREQCFPRLLHRITEKLG